MPLKLWDYRIGRPKRQVVIRLDDTAVHASNSKGFHVWRGPDSPTVNFIADAQQVVTATQTFGVYENGGSLGNITIANGARQGTLSAFSTALAAGDLIEFYHTAGDSSGLRFQITAVEQ